jgi:hypothetical protein
MTFLSPSSISLSFRLSSSFFIWAAGNVFVELRELLAEWAASSVSSRAAEHVSELFQLEMDSGKQDKSYRSPVNWIF